MVKPNVKVNLALAGVALATASVATVLLVALQGSTHWSQLLVFVATAVLGFASALLLWLLGARQLRVQRAHVTKTILKGIASLEADSKRDIAALRDDVGAVREQNVALDKRQRKLLNVVRSEAAAEREQFGAFIEALNVQDERLSDMQRALNGIGSLRDELGSLHVLTEAGMRSGAESARESRDGLKELRSLVRKAVDGVDAVDSRDRKMLNLLRGEIRDSTARSEDVKKALAVEGRKADKAAASVDEAAIAVRKMHNFLRRDGSIQIAVDRFTAAERRMLAAVEAAGLDHADQVTAIKATLDADREQEIAARSRLGTEVNSALEELRTEFASSLVGLGADFDGLRDHVTGVSVSEARLVESLNSKGNQLHATLDTRFRGMEEEFADLTTQLGEKDINGVAEKSHSAHEGGSVGHGNPPSLPELIQAYDSVGKAVARVQTGRLERYIKRQSIDVIRQVEALMQLVPRVESHLRRFPPSGWWALPADTLLFLSDYIEHERPQRILEIGSGSSTVWIGTFAKRVGAELVSLEHDADYVQKTRALVNEYGLHDAVTVHHAPLRPVELEEGSFNWYDSAVVSALEGPYDLLIVDGPPEATGEKARMPALPMLEPLLSEECLVLLDDTHRPDEKEILKSWVAKFEGFEAVESDLMRTGMIARSVGVVSQRPEGTGAH